MALDEFVPIKGYEGLYSISRDGRVWSHRSEIFIKTGDNGRGYKFLYLHNSGNKNRQYLHRLVAEAFLDNPDNLPQVNHLDGNKSNNNALNLEWSSLENNMQHAWKNGLCKPEYKQKLAAIENAKKRRLFSNKEILKMRDLYAKGFGYKKLSKIFNVTTGAIRHIVLHKTYKEVA